MPYNRKVQLQAVTNYHLTPVCKQPMKLVVFEKNVALKTYSDTRKCPLESALSSSTVDILRLAPTQKYRSQNIKQTALNV